MSDIQEIRSRRLEIARVQWEMARFDYENSRAMHHGFPSEVSVAALRKTREALEAAVQAYEAL